MKISDKVKLLTNEYDKFIKYTNLSQTVVYIDIGDIQKEIKKSFLQINEIVNDISYISPNLIPENIFHIWHLSEYILYLIEKILIEVTDNKSNIDSVKYEESINNMQLTFDLLNKKNMDVNKTIIEFFTSSTIWESNILTLVNQYTKFVKEFPFSITLYTPIIQSSLKYCVNYDKSMCNKIFNMVDDVKNSIILNDIPQKFGKKILYDNNPRLKTFGLTPRGPSSSLKGIFKYIYGESSLTLNIKKQTNLEKIAKTKNVCIVIFNSVIKNPMEFELWKLVDWGYANDLIQPDNTGINTKTIDRFTTYKFLDSNRKYHKWNFKTQYYGDIDSELFIILEHMGLDVYRQLSIYNFEESNSKFRNFKNDKKGGKSLKRLIQRSKINNIILYIKNKGISYDNTRISEYNKIQENIIIKKMFLPIKFDLSDIKEDSQELDTAYLQHKIKSLLINICMDIVKKQYKNGANIKTNIDIGKIIHSEELTNMLVPIFIDQYKLYLKNKTISNKFQPSELLHTLLNQLKLVKREFIREIHTRFTEVEIDSHIFNLTSSKKNQELEKIFSGIIALVIDKLVSNENNVYQSLIYKNGILNLSPI
jgi:hypothetical protein